MGEFRMSRSRAAAMFVGLGLVAAGCAGMGVVKTAGEKGVAPQPAAAAPVVPQVAKVAGPTLDPREERRLGKDLVRDVGEYYKRLKEKNVEEATEYVDPQYRKGYQDDLWSFIAAYALESAQVESYQLFPQVDGVMAKVKVGRTLFEKGSVVPHKSEIWMTWTQRDGRWLIRPQEQK